MTVTLPHLQIVLQGQDTRITNLPDDAVLPAPVGAFGPGALYFLNTHETTQGEPFLKLGFVTFRRSGLCLTGGRFEYADGLETEPANPTLAFLKHNRLAERLIGPFSYSHVSRSFDGHRFSYDRPGWNLTGMAVRPTDGGFEVMPAAGRRTRTSSATRARPPAGTGRSRSSPTSRSASRC